MGAEERKGKGAGRVEVEQQARISTEQGGEVDLGSGVASFPI